MFDYDFVIVGSGFGGSVAALRLTEPGQRVLMLEKGRYVPASELPKSNWNLRRWLWMPRLGMRGLFRMTVFRHMTVLSGVGVGGGSLTYGAALPTPPEPFFRAGNWCGLADWSAELAPHYATARRMLGVTRSPIVGEADRALAEVARRRGEAERCTPNDVGIYFGAAGREVPDPFFGGDGPSRTGCVGCGGCMLGCAIGAKNSLDKNYLHLARARGLELESETEVTAVRALEGGGYHHCGPNEHVQPVRYRDGSGFFRLLMFPHVPGATTGERLLRLLALFIRHPLAIARAFTVANMARRMSILMYMRTEESTLRFQRAWHGGLTTRREEGAAPVASFPAATELARQASDVLDGFPMAFIQETLFNIPTTAHVLGGAVMGEDITSGVIDRDHRVFGYEGLYIMDGSAVSSNPGVNPSLTITAMAERALAQLTAAART